MKQNVLMIVNFLFFSSFYLVAMKQDISSEQLSSLIKNSAISEEEKEYLLRKNASIKKAAEAFFNIKLPQQSQIPTIGFAFSGGGYRAMIAAAGCSLGAENAQYLPIVRYSAGVSGSTWWQAFMHIRNDIPSACIQILKKRVCTSFFDPFTLNYKRIVEMLEQLHKESRIEFVDVWGALIVERLFGDLSENPLELTFDEVRKNLVTSQLLPFPIFSTVIPVENSYQWGEINPWRGGSRYLQGFTSTSLFGSMFDNESLMRKVPEYSLSFFLGIFGSAYALSFHECLQYIKHNTLEEILKSIFDKIPNIAQKHFAPAIAENFMYNFKGPLKNLLKIPFIDAGHDINLGIPPLLDPERSVDIIIVSDASSDASVKEYPELCKAALWAKKHGRPFPDITSSCNVIDNDIAYFYDTNNAAAPIVIYLANPIDDSTLEFDYDAEKFNQLRNANIILAEKASDCVKKALQQKLEYLSKL